LIPIVDKVVVGEAGMDGEAGLTTREEEPECWRVGCRREAERRVSPEGTRAWRAVRVVAVGAASLDRSCVGVGLGETDSCLDTPLHRGPTYYSQHQQQPPPLPHHPRQQSHLDQPPPAKNHQQSPKTQNNIDVGRHGLWNGRKLLSHFVRISV
jgi:hypothetical protein